MGFFDKLKEIWSKPEGLKKSPHLTTEDIIRVCMADICSVLVNNFSSDYYNWDEAEEIKTFECLILAKFFMTHALQKTYDKELDKQRIVFYLNIIQHYFILLLHEIFLNRCSYDTVREIVETKLDLYHSIISKESHPVMWQLIAGACTGIDYHIQQDIKTLIGSSTMLPPLVMHAQDSLKLVISRVEENGYAIIPCLSCGAKNKIKFRSAVVRPICGKCQAAFFSWN